MPLNESPRTIVRVLKTTPSFAAGAGCSTGDAARVRCTAVAAVEACRERVGVEFRLPRDDAVERWAVAAFATSRLASTKETRWRARIEVPGLPYLVEEPQHFGAL